MNEIKPVAWRYRDSELLSDWDWHFLELPPLLRYSEVQALYEQSAIDRLTAERDAAVAERDNMRSAIATLMALSPYGK